MRQSATRGNEDMEHDRTDGRVVRRAGVVANALSDSEAVMLDVERGTYFGVRNVGKVIWDAIETPIRIDDLVAGLVETYDVDEAVCRSDVLAFLGQLREQGLVDVASVNSPG